MNSSGLLSSSRLVRNRRNRRWIRGRNRNRVRRSRNRRTGTRPVCSISESRDD